MQTQSGYRKRSVSSSQKWLSLVLSTLIRSILKLNRCRHRCRRLQLGFGRALVPALSALAVVGHSQRTGSCKEAAGSLFRWSEASGWVLLHQIRLTCAHSIGDRNVAPAGGTKAEAVQLAVVRPTNRINSIGRDSCPFSGYGLTSSQHICAVRVQTGSDIVITT